MFNSEETNEFKKYCQKLSADNLLFQGAGGNTSIKSGKSLLIKASGKWMSNSLNDKIFVIVNLEDISDQETVAKLFPMFKTSDNKAQIKIAFKGSDPAEGIMKINDTLVKTIP